MYESDRSMRRLVQTGMICLLLAFLTALPARGAKIAISIPLSGDAAELGRNFRAGMKLAMEVQGISHELFVADDGCDPDLADIAADDIASQQPDIVIGMICNDAAKKIATRLSTGIAPVIVSGARSVRLIKDRSREQWNLWRLSPGDDYPVRVAADAIVELWQQTPFAVVDDGTIYGRNFTDNLRALLQDRGLEPQFSDTFRAAQSTQAGLLRRLQRSGVEAAFIAAATTEDLFTVAANMNELDIGIDLVMSEAIAVLPFLEEAERVPAGLKIVAAPPLSDPELAELLQQREIDATQQFYDGFAAIQLADGILSLAEGTDISAQTYATIFGDIAFTPDGASSYNPYRLLRWNGEALISETHGSPDQ